MQLSSLLCVQVRRHKFPTTTLSNAIVQQNIHARMSIEQAPFLIDYNVWRARGSTREARQSAQSQLASLAADTNLTCFVGLQDLRADLL